jgi:hypothetical protein
MLAVLFYTLQVAEQEDRKWTAQRTRNSQVATTNEPIETITFVLPFEHSSRIQDAIGLQWPLFAAAEFLAPVPQMYYSGRKPIPLTLVSYAVLTLVVGAYWFGVGVWMDKRLIQRRRPSHSRLVRITLKVIAAPTILLFILFFGKDVAGGWPEGPQGAYGVTAWLATASMMLLAELGFLPKGGDSGRPSVR